MKKLIDITENKVLGKLPDPFVFDDGTRVKTADDWERRRKEIYKTAVELQYGTIPPEPEFSKTNTSIFGSVEGTTVEVETDGENPQHIGVLNAWGGAIINDTPMVADGSEGINGLTISNAMHLSAFLNREIEIPFDEDVYYEELMKRVKTSRRKTNVTEAFADTSKTYGGV